MKEVKDMDIKAKKLDLIQWLIQLNDERLLRKIEAIQSEDADFWNELNEHEKQEIKKGLGELEAGQKHEYEQVISKFR
jgi:hypothetical protein